jgi:hypothetical protein
MQYTCSIVTGSHAKLGEITASEQTLHTSSTPQCLHQDVPLLVTCLDDFAAAHSTMILCTSSIIVTIEETYKGVSLVCNPCMAHSQVKCLLFIKLPARHLSGKQYNKASARNCHTNSEWRLHSLSEIFLFLTVTPAVDFVFLR